MTTSSSKTPQGNLVLNRRHDGSLSSPCDRIPNGLQGAHPRGRLSPILGGGADGLSVGLGMWSVDKGRGRFREFVSPDRGGIFGRALQRADSSGISR